jgi:hypothetical protein
MMMSVSADLITVRKIALAKQLYQHAVTQAAHDTLTARILSVISFDLATETLLRAAVASLDPSRTPADGFSGLIQQLESLLVSASLGPLPDRGNVIHVHSIRNDAQHRARHPSKTEVSDARTYTRDFLNKATQLLWGLNIDAVSLVDLVSHQRLRDLLQDAERHFQAHEFVRTAEQACAALTLAYEYVEDSIVGRLPGFTGGFAMHDAWGKPASQHDSREMLRAFERMRDTVLISALGLNYTDQARFRQLAGSVSFTMDGKAHPHGAKQTLSEAEAEFVLAYAIGAVQQIETTVGDIEKPFESED